MKKLVVFFISITFILNSCAKFEDGPAFSLHSKTHRLANIWLLDKAYETVNGVTSDRTSDYQAYYYNALLTIDKKNLYTFSYSQNNILAYSEDGTWVYSGDKTHVYFTALHPSSTALGTDWTILKLKEKEYWGQYTQSNGTIVEIHFIPRFK